jgi:hypothetical protein
MSKYAQGESSVKEVKNADFFASLSVGEVKEVKKKAKSKKKTESK